MRPTAVFVSILMLSGCAPMAESPQGGQASVRRCFSPEGARLIKLDPAAGAYVRTRSGQSLELTGLAACLDAPGDPGIALVALGPDDADVCLGDSARLRIRSQAAVERTCDVRVARVVPQDEIARMSGRQIP